MPLKTSEGKWIVFDRAGRQLERWPIDAKLLLQNGEVTDEAPAGQDVKLPPALPAHVGAPKAVVAQVFEGENVAGTPTDVAPAGGSTGRGRAK